MFGFLSKCADRAAPQPVVETQAAVRAEASQLSDQARQQALSQADMLSDGAAQRVQSREALEKVLQACCNTDRRVAKLMQNRLDGVRQQQLVTEKASASVTGGAASSAGTVLMPNWVAAGM